MAQKKPVFREGQQIRDYQIVRYISQGSYGQIFEATNVKNPNRRLALKALYQVQFREHRKLLELYQNEVSLLKKLKGHANVCEYIDNFEDMKYKYLIMEYCNGGDLIQLLKQQERFSEVQAISYLGEILEAFKAFHKQDKHIIHRDIKLDNIFVHDGVCKLGDFGFAREVPKGKDLAQTWCGSLLTMAPEVIDGKKGYGIQADIYSLGAILYQMVFGDFPYKCYNDNEPQLLRDIKNRKMNLSKFGVQISNDLKELLLQMTTFDPNERITFEQLYNHKFFNKTNERRTYFEPGQDNLKYQQNFDNTNQDNLQVIPEEDIKINLKLVGYSNVGKTSICNSYIYGDMNTGSNEVTLGMTYFKKNIQIGQDPVQLSLFDTAGLEKHNSLPTSYFKQSDGYVLVFDLSDPNSLEGIDFWINEIKKNDQNEFEDGIQGREHIIVVGNKMDLEENLINSQQYKDKKRQLSDKGIKVLEVSAKNNENINVIFNTIGKQILAIKKNFSQMMISQQKETQKQEDPSKIYRTPSVKIRNESVKQFNPQNGEQKKKSGCC